MSIRKNTGIIRQSAAPLLAAAMILSCTSWRIAGQAQADELEVVVEESTAAEQTELAAEVTDDTVEAEEKTAAPEEIPGLFVDTGEETVSQQGDTLEEAREKDDPRYGYGDGGSTVNIGHLYEINGVLVRNSDFPSEHYACWTYANNVYAKIWGHNFYNLFNDSENLLRNLPDEELTLTPEHLKAYVSAAPAGAVLRVCDAQYLHADDGWGHSQIIISHDENGFTVFEGGLAAFPHRREAYYTWTGFCYSGWPGKYHYIKYVKWPGAGTYQAGAAGSNALDLGESGMEQLQPKVEKTFQDLVGIVSDLIRGEAKEEDVERVLEAIERAALEEESETGHNAVSFSAE